MDRTQRLDDELSAVAEYLDRRRDDILAAWQKAVSADPSLTTASSLPRRQFYDHIPDLLDAIAEKLRTWPAKQTAAAKDEQTQDAREHGLQRWQQGYHLREVTREWGHFHLCLVEELELFEAANPALERGVMPTARRAIAQLCNEGVCESTARYFQLQQTEATGHVRDLSQAIEQVRELDRQRAELWRQAAHDLRGNLGVVANATAGLTLAGLPESAREDFVRLLQLSVSSLQALLEDVMDLARLQAGQERRVVKPFDAALLLREMCENLKHHATDGGLYLNASGPETLLVHGDPIKIRRIAQNLLLNALKYTQRGGVTMSWGDSRQNDRERWMLCVEDTGPGFHAGPGAPLAEALKDATQDSYDIEERSEGGDPGETGDGAPSARPSSDIDDRAVNQEPGEGIGLSIVKRLCELLDASVELDSTIGKGTTLRVILPRQYETPPADENRTDM